MGFITTWRDVAILTDDIISIDDTYDQEAYERDCQNVKIVLSFTAMLLSNTVEKGLYSSTEVMPSHRYVCLQLIICIY